MCSADATQCVLLESRFFRRSRSHFIPTGQFGWWQSMAGSSSSTSSSTVRNTWRRRKLAAASTAPASAAAPPSEQAGVQSDVPRRRCPPWLIGRAVERRRWDDPEVDGFLRRGEPVVLTDGCPLVSSLVGHWDFGHLSEAFGDYDKLPVHFAPQEVTVFSRMYGEGLGAGGVSTMSFAQFAAVVRQQHLERRESERAPLLRYYLQTPMVWHERDESDPHGPSADETDGKPMSSAPFGPQLHADMGTVGWSWLKRARELSGCRVSK